MKRQFKSRPFLTDARILPVIILGLAALSLFVLQSHENGFKWGQRGFLSSHGMALAKNLLNEDHPFFMYAERSIQGERVTYDAYNRFPVVPFLFVAGVIRPLEPDLAAQIYAARQLMNLFLILALAVAFLLLKRLTGDPTMSATLALAAFSSHYVLFFGDMIFNDTPAVFGFLLVLYLVGESRAGKVPRWMLLAVPAISGSLAWQPLAVFMTWSGVDLAAAIFPKKGSLRARLLGLRHRPSCTAMVAALVWGGIILSAQLLNEWRIVGGAFQALPSVHSALWRIGAASESNYAEYRDALVWGSFLLEQARRAVTMLTPFTTVLDLTIPIGSLLSLPLFLIALVGLVLGYRASSRGRPDLGTVAVFALSGLVWSMLMRHFVAFHAFQALYYIGFVLILYRVVALFLDVRVWRFLLPAAALLFVTSVYRVNVGKSDIAAEVNAVTAEFQSIRDHLPTGSRVFVDGDRHELGMTYHAVDFYLAGTYTAPAEEARYVVSKDPSFPGRRLTANAKINLFERVDR